MSRGLMWPHGGWLSGWSPAGRVVNNGAPHGPLAPAFGGFKQSGIGREYSRSGLEAHLKARAIPG
jgi:acyl-CoA reductase-like NAD-dependent aldehyde dehydrogenase